MIGGDLPVARMGFGTVRLTGAGVWGPPPDPEASRQLLRTVVGNGVDLIDTSSSYGPHLVEEMIAEALNPYPSHVVIATKGGLAPSGPGRFERDGRPASLRANCEGSLRRLRVDHIALYQLHAVDPAVPLEESVGALAELQGRGLIRHIGLSNVTVDQLARAQQVAQIVSVQNCFNVVDRQYDNVVEACEAASIAFMPWFPLARGLLSKPDSILQRIAGAKDASPSQIALAWLLHRSPVVLPIPGTSNAEHFRSNQRAVNVELDAADLEALDQLDRDTPPLVDDPSR
jgi:pyridoxine 4-dehydrogenase